MGSVDSLFVKRLRPALSGLRHVYLGLCVLGVVVPYSQFTPWLLQYGLDMDLFMRELFATRIGAFFAFDVVVLRLRSSSLSSLSGQLVSDTCGCPSLLLLWLVVSLGLPLFPLHAATLPRCDHRLTQRRPKRAVFALCVSYSCD